MRQALRIGALIVGAGLACSTASKSGQPSPATVAPEDIQALVAEALQRALVDAQDLPDFKLLPQPNAITVRTEVPSPGLLLDRRALPPSSEISFALLTEREIHALADRQGGAVYYVSVNNVTVKGDVGTAWIGVDLATPKAPAGSVKLCCCSEAVNYKRANGRWRFVGQGPGVCF